MIKIIVMSNNVKIGEFIPMSYGSTVKISEQVRLWCIENKIIHNDFIDWKIEDK
jgi:hypothetical protein